MVWVVLNSSFLRFGLCYHALLEVNLNGVGWFEVFFFEFGLYGRLNDIMESKGGKKSSSSSSSSSSKSQFYEAPLGYSIEDVRPNGGIKKFRSAAYSNCARKPS
ncbi:hypothetical protein Acr_29g0007080 [Actinidia rufa]|uniref:S-adenosyl-L-methionine-dependent methyltransferases superfamily protein n=1 Tax=Actinidia rufa TaxID=165716 RepID=A0A7J0HEL3_9ERIC|nr:hypothetical protein Acr_29g0007080 [Actinidia rufa]